MVAAARVASANTGVLRLSSGPEFTSGQESGMKPESKNALIAFILAVVGFGFACAWIAGIVGTVLGIVALQFHKKIDKPVEQQPFKVFEKIAKIVAIVDIILGAVLFVVALIVIIVGAVAAAAAAAA